MATITEQYQDGVTRTKMLGHVPSAKFCTFSALTICMIKFNCFSLSLKLAYKGQKVVLAMFCSILVMRSIHKDTLCSFTWLIRL
jgi:hypothetical protein